MQNRTWVEISKSAVKKNIQAYSKLLPEETSLMAVVKANAYGHGLQIISDIAVESGVDELAVFELEDALVIRKTHHDTPILVLNQINADEFDIAVKNNIDITVASVANLKEILAYKKRKHLLLNLKIDTGLSRQGFQMSELNTVIDILKQNTDLQIPSIYTHLIGAENKKFNSYTEKQVKNIYLWQDKLAENGYYPLISISGTAGFLMNEDLANDCVRLGIGMYGLWPSSEVKNYAENKIKLIPALSWKTRINQVKVINAGETVAYNATFIANKNTKIAVLPVGYWDGIPRSMSNKGYMLVDGVKCPILGRVMMNMCVIDVSNVKNAKAGSEVVIIGSQKKAIITATEIADITGTIDYEIVTRINAIIPRIAIK